MSNIDDLFKGQPGPSKRRSEAIKDPTELYKRAKLNGASDVHQGTAATVEDADDNNEDDEYAGPELPPDFDEDGDEEGRFFGGGVDGTTARAMEYVEELEKDGEADDVKIDAAWLRKTALSFEKKISKNAELRAKHESNPAKFMGSEADLDAEIKALSVLAEQPELYGELVRLGCEQSLVSLLSHENTDIAIDAVEVINELIEDPDSGGSASDDGRTLVEAMLDADLVDLLYQNLGRLDETADADRDGVYHILASFEALSHYPLGAAKLAAHPSIQSWLVTRATAAEQPVGQNKQYAAEVLAALVADPGNLAAFVAAGDKTDALLQAASAYRRRDPEPGSDEELFVESVFEVLTAAVRLAAGKAALLAAEGVELCVLMLREGGASKPPATKLLDYTLSPAPADDSNANDSKQNSTATTTTPSGHEDVESRCAERIVEAGGLKPTFAALAKAAAHAAKRGEAAGNARRALEGEYDTERASHAEHVLGVVGGLLRLVPGESAARVRLLAKFVERDYAALGRLVGLRRAAAARLARYDADVAAMDDELNEDFVETVRIGLGEFQIQQVDTILAWLVAEDDGARARIVELLAERDEGLGDLSESLKAQLAAAGEERSDTRDMLEALVAALDGLVG